MSSQGWRKPGFKPNSKDYFNHRPIHIYLVPPTAVALGAGDITVSKVWPSGLENPLEKKRFSPCKPSSVDYLLMARLSFLSQYQRIRFQNWFSWAGDCSPFLVGGSHSEHSSCPM